MKEIANKIVYISILILFFTSCKKNGSEPTTVDPEPIDTTKVYLSNVYESKLRDSIWYYYKVLSLWQEVIPPTENISKIDELGYIRENYAKFFATGDNVLDHLKALTKSELPNRVPKSNYDWYSFLDRGAVISSEIQQTITSGLGMSVFYLQTNSTSNNADLYIRIIEKNSSAYDAGLQRGDQIISINEDTNLDYNYQKSKKFSPLTGYLNANSITIKVRKTTGILVEKTILYKQFSSDPILVNQVINIDSRKIGYFLLNSFASIKNRGTYTNFYTKLENLFSNFEQEGITELIIDLRTNGGGDVETAQYLADRIAPASESGKRMYSYKINKLLEGWGWLNQGEEFAPINFNKRGSLALNRVYFLVSPGTASASELLINSLTAVPSFNTYLIGTYSINDKNETIADKTYGKPVGFFGLPVLNDNIELYVTSFQMYNRDGKGDYFDGLTPTANVWEFKNFHDFGNESETMLATALNHIKTGSFSDLTLRASLNNQSYKPFSKADINLDNKSNKGDFGMYKFKDQKLKNN